MPKTICLTQSLDGLVRIALPSGRVVAMSIAAFAQAMEAGKAAALRQLDALAHAAACREEAQWREARVVRLEDDDAAAD